MVFLRCSVSIIVLKTAQELAVGPFGGCHMGWMLLCRKTWRPSLSCNGLRERMVYTYSRQTDDDRGLAGLAKQKDNK